MGLQGEHDRVGVQLQSQQHPDLGLGGALEDAEGPHCQSPVQGQDIPRTIRSL